MMTVAQFDAEEVVNGLQTVRMALSRCEKEYLDYACECVLIVDKLQKMIEEVRKGE
ncbi:MAG: hypothetical protein IIY21_19195 [Clostridiales bacterium]|nr:hypothetical protein [Clostridiales bacterium]MBQ1570352.1 hypothetical protein [Clostridiales bacterium]